MTVNNIPTEILQSWNAVYEGNGLVSERKRDKSKGTAHG